MGHASGFRRVPSDLAHARPPPRRPELRPAERMIVGSPERFNRPTLSGALQLKGGGEQRLALHVVTAPNHPSVA